jgi:hypothetical protein
MFREMTDLFCDEGAWIEIGQRGRYHGKARIHRFLHQVLGDGRWGLLRDEVINHVQQQPIVTVADDRERAWSRARAQVQGNSPPDTPHFLLADGIYENEYVREGGRWKIRGVTVTMTFYAALERARIWFPSAPPSETFPPDARASRSTSASAPVQPVALRASDHRRAAAVPVSDPGPPTTEDCRGRGLPADGGPRLSKPHAGSGAVRIGCMRRRPSGPVGLRRRARLPAGERRAGADRPALHRARHDLHARCRRRL